MLEVTSLYIKDIISPFILKCLSVLPLAGCKSATVSVLGSFHYENMEDKHSALLSNGKSSPVVMRLL